MWEEFVVEVDSSATDYREIELERCIETWARSEILVDHGWALLTCRTDDHVKFFVLPVHGFNSRRSDPLNPS